MGKRMRESRPMEVWVLRRLERLMLLAPADGLPFGFSRAEAQRLLAYTGFSLCRDADAIGLHSACDVLAGGKWRGAKAG